MQKFQQWLEAQTGLPQQYYVPPTAHNGENEKGAKITLDNVLEQFKRNIDQLSKKMYPQILDAYSKRHAQNIQQGVHVYYDLVSEIYELFLQNLQKEHQAYNAQVSDYERKYQ